MLWVALAIGALLAGKCLSFVSTLADTAAKMALLLSSNPIGPALTPEVPPRFGSIVYLRSAAYTLASLSNRAAEGGDAKRALVAKEMIRRLISARPDIARYL